MKSRAGRWMVPQPVPGATPRRRLFCVPFAGGGTIAFHGWSAALPPDLQVCSVLLPGRESRLAEGPIARLAELVPRLADGLAPYFDLPFAFFGHSVGALIAFELARELRRRGGPHPMHLFVSAFRAPHRPNPNRALHRLAEPELIRELQGYGGIPEAVLASRELLELVIPTIRADFALHETYVHQDEPPLQVPLTLFGGTEDDKVRPAHLDGWQNHTQGRFRQVLFEGDHFFLKPFRAQLFDVLLQDLNDGPSALERQA